MRSVDSKHMLYNSLNNGFELFIALFFNVSISLLVSLLITKLIMKYTNINSILPVFACMCFLYCLILALIMIVYMKNYKYFERWMEGYSFTHVRNFKEVDFYYVKVGILISIITAVISLFSTLISK